MSAYERFLLWSEGSRLGAHAPKDRAEEAAFIMFQIMDENGIGLYGDRSKRLDEVIKRMASLN